MNFVKEETLLGNKKIIVGDRMHDLVLENLGRIYIRYGNSYKDFNSIISSINQITKSFDRMTIEENGLQDPSTYSDNSFVYDVRGERLFLVYNGELLLLAETAQNKNNKYVLKSGDIMTGQLQIQTNDAPLFVRSSKLVKNFNSEYLNGYRDTDFAKKAKDEIIVGDWTFKGKNTFTEKNTFEETAIFTKSKGTAIKVGTGDIITDGSLGASSFVSGMNGHGWRLDASTNTLTIDNLIVRGILQVFELQVNKISATNGALWITDSFKIKSIHKVIPIDYSKFTTLETFETEAEQEEFNGTRLKDFNEFLQNINFNTDDYYIPYSSTKMIEGLINEYSSGKNITSFIPPIGSLASRTTKETSEDGLPFYIYNHLFKVNNLIKFKNNFSNISLFSESTLKELFMDDIIDYKHVLQKYSLRQEELEQIGDKYIEPFDDTFDKHWYEVVIGPKFDKNKRTYYIETDENGNIKEENIANINLYYKYFGSLNKDYPNLYVLESEEGEYPVFRPGDILRCQKFTGNGVKQYHAIVCGIIGEYGILVQLQRNSVLNQKTTYEYDDKGNLISSSVEYDTSFYDRSATAGGDVSQVGNENADIFNYGPQKDDALVRIGSIIKGDRQNSMYLTSSEDNSPFEDIIVGINRPDYTVQYFTLGEKYIENELLFYKVELESNTKVRMGNLTGIYNEKYGNKQPHGYGLYGENVFLTGEFYLNNGKSMMSIDNDIQIAVGNITEIEKTLQNVATPDNINAAVENAIIANKDSIMRMGLDYNLFALGSAGMTIVNPNATYDENGNVNPETVGDGDEYIKLLGDKVQINTYVKDKSGKYKILYTSINPELWEYDEEGRPKTKAGDYIEFYELKINSIKGKTKQLPRTVKVNNQLFSLCFESKVPYEFKLKDNNNIYSISLDNHFETCGYYRYNINPTLAGLQLQIDFLPNRLPIVNVGDYVYNFDNDNTTDTSGEYKITEIVSYTDTSYYYFPILSQSALFENGKLNADLIEVRELNGIDTKNIKTVSLNTHREGETILYWPDGSIMNAKVLTKFNNEITGCQEFFINKGWWWNSQNEAYNHSNNHGSVNSSVCETYYYDNLKNSIEPNPDVNGIIRVFNYFLEAVDLPWQSSFIYGIKQDQEDSTFQKVINSSNNNSKFIDIINSERLSTPLPKGCWTEDSDNTFDIIYGSNAHSSILLLQQMINSNININYLGYFQFSSNESSNKSVSFKETLDYFKKIGDINIKIDITSTQESFTTIRQMASDLNDYPSEGTYLSQYSKFYYQKINGDYAQFTTRQQLLTIVCLYLLVRAALSKLSQYLGFKSTYNPVTSMSDVSINLRDNGILMKVLVGTPFVYASLNNYKDYSEKLIKSDTVVESVFGQLIGNANALYLNYFNANSHLVSAKAGTTDYYTVGITKYSQNIFSLQEVKMFIVGEYYDIRENSYFDHSDWQSLISYII